MRTERLALLAFLASAGEETSAFTLPCFRTNRVFASQRKNSLEVTPFIHGRESLNGSDGDDKDDQGLEKSRLKAYEDWRIKFGKGDFDQNRYENFKTNYITLLHHNTAEASAARSEGRPEPEVKELNEHGDLSKEEYAAVLHSKASSSLEEPTRLKPKDHAINRVGRGSFQKNSSTVGTRKSDKDGPKQ